MSALARTRTTMALLVVGCLGLVGMAIASPMPNIPGLQFFQVGHWVYNEALGSAFHVDGSTRKVDARAYVPGASQGSQVVQGEKSGFVVSRERITGFGKATLSVESSVNPPALATPVALEVAGGPYLVYENAGQIVRLSDPVATIPAGGPVERPVTMPDGTVWLYRMDSGALCELPQKATVLACRTTVPREHEGTLTAVAGRPVFVDTTSDTLHPIDKDGLGEPASLEVDLPPNAKIAANDADGRLAAIDPDRGRLHLIDTAGLAKTRPVAPPVSVELAKSRTYANPVAVAQTIAVIDETANQVLTYDRHGAQRSVTKVPGSADKPRLVGGEDKRIYVDSADGSHVLVVDGENGAVHTVPVDGTVSGPPTAPEGVPTGEPTGPPAAAPTAPPTSTSQPPPLDLGKLVAPASPPGAPRSVTASGGEGAATVTWKAAAKNGAPVRAYLLSWPGGSKTVDGDTSQATVTGLTNGRSYVITIAARNSAGTGPGASAKPITPQATAAPPAVTAKGASGVTTVSWKQPDLAGGTLLHYQVSASGQGDRLVRDATSTEYTTLEGSTTFTVRAVTTPGPSGGPTITGKPGTAKFTPPVEKATGKITRVKTTGAKSIAVTVDVNPQGSPTKCALGTGFGGPIRTTVSCSGVQTVPVTGVDPGVAGFHHVNLVLSNAAGTSATIVWISIPEPQDKQSAPADTGNVVIWLVPIGLLLARVRKGRTR